VCYSAPASLVASGVLAVSGIAILRMPKKKSEIPLSLFPLIFSVHQLTEGLLWLNHTGSVPDTYKQGLIYAFVLIAFVFWPIYVPFSAYCTETGRMRRKIIILCQLVGIYIGITFLVSIIRNTPDATFLEHSISYGVHGPPKSLAPYMIAVTVPFLLASDKRLLILGVALLVACATAVYTACSGAFPSVWCFYASILSLIIYLRLRYQAKAASKNRNMDLQHST
jgi:hypothetical protein